MRTYLLSLCRHGKLTGQRIIDSFNSSRVTIVNDFVRILSLYLINHHLKIIKMMMMLSHENVGKYVGKNYYWSETMTNKRQT